jgi:hypothetical protein
MKKKILVTAYNIDDASDKCGAVATKAVAVGGRACARELYTMKQCCLGSGYCCLYSTRAHTRNKNDVLGFGWSYF